LIQPSWQLVRESKAGSTQQVVDVLLENRGVGPSFFNCSLTDLEPYLNICGMDEGAELMASHLINGHKVVLVGDYDCDGVTSVAQMSLFLKDIGYGNHEVIIPHRAEGYGMPAWAARKNPDAGLFVVMDCGTADVKPITEARQAGADCIVIDHHEVPKEGAAPATILINPKQPGCTSVFKEFCSAGLTLLFLTRLRKAIRGKFETPRLGGKYLSLATLGTVADIVPLLEGNRILVRTGLTSINRRTYSPLEQVVQVSGLSGKMLTAGHLGYYVGPRVNAAGRVADARVAFDLLVAEQPDEMGRLARELNHFNVRRQSEEESILKDVRQRFTDMRAQKRTLVMGDCGWSAGVVGIVAARIQRELHYGPAIIFSVDESGGVARGSGRSVPGFDLHGAVKCCEDLLLKWGGHKMAVGMTVSLDRLDEFAERFELVAGEYPAELFLPKAKVDMELDLHMVTPELVRLLKKLEPHGMGNPTPVFAARGTTVSVQKVFGKEGGHLRLLVGGRIGAVFWKGGFHRQSMRWHENELLDVVFQVEWDEFRRAPVLNVKDIGHLFQS
jgi:single-stranded-DNA-specific exonuclease